MSFVTVSPSWQPLTQHGGVIKQISLEQVTQAAVRVLCICTLSASKPAPDAVVLRFSMSRKGTCSIWTLGPGISAPMRRSSERMVSREMPRRRISASTALVVGTKLAGISSAASIGASSGASSPTSRSPGLGAGMLG